jgi:DNA-binding NtrC family response regulator
LLLDLQLADGDGLSLLDQWPAEQERPAVIVLTADVAREAEQRVKQTGSILLRKPISAAELRAAIARACGGARSVTPTHDVDAEMASLVEEAREEIVKRTAELVELVEGGEPLREIQQHAHKLAGLAAQFDAAGIADAADRIEQACAAGLAPTDCLFPLKDALAERRTMVERVALPGVSRL